MGPSNCFNHSTAKVLVTSTTTTSWFSKSDIILNKLYVIFFKQTEQECLNVNEQLSEETVTFHKNKNRV